MATADENLKNQFQLLQEQQQKKLLRRKQRKEEQQRAHTASVISSSSIASSKAFGVSDQLDLKLAEPVTQPKSYLSDELVDHLNEKIRELKDENGRVYKLLSERDFELRQVKKKWEEEKIAHAAAGGPVTNETAGTKIVELSKKIREMTAELESEKTKCRQLTKKCHELQTQVTANNADNKSMRASTVSLRSSIDEKPDDPNEIKVLQDKLKQMESKVVDYRNSNSSLKQELRLATKALAQEVGENVSIQNCLNGTSSWRGRQQQILQLQSKVEELKIELQRANNLKEKGEHDMEMSETISGRKKTAVDRHKEQLKKMEKEKKESQEKIMAAKEALEEENFALKHRLDAAKTRNDVLSSEIKSLKKQVPQLLKKNEHDNELIEALMIEQTKLKKQLSDAQNVEHNLRLEQQTKLNEITGKQQHEANVVDQLKKIISDKETKVNVLENEIQQLKLAHLQRAQMNKVFYPRDQANTPGQLAPPTHIDSRPSTGFETIDLQYTVEEGSPPESRLSERVPSTNGVPVTSDHVKPPSRGQSRGPSRGVRPLSGHRPPSASGAIVSDLQYQCQELRTVAQVAEVERDKLMELMKVLQARCDEANLKVQDHQRELVEQRRKNAMLEKQLGKASLTNNRQGNSSARPGNTSARRQSSKMTSSISNMPAMIEEEELNALNLDDLRVNLEIQQDENKALKAALQSTLKAKEEDFRVYSETIEETKKVFLQALRQYKQTVQPS